MQADQEGLHAITSQPFEETVMDVVFVHGLGGGAYSTWRHEGSAEGECFSWPHELDKEFPDCAVWTFGYAAGFTHFGNPGMCIEKRAGNFAAQLLQAKLGKRPIVFITHSMGGLVVKELIVSSVFKKRTGLPDLVAKISGIVFCGTPHRGSELAAAAGKLGRYFSAGGAVIAGFVGWTIGDIIGRLLGTQPHVREMEANAEPLDLLHDKFLAWHQDNPGVRVKSYAENAGLFRKTWPGRLLPLGLVVPRASANPGTGTITDVDADHLSLVKPHPGNKAVFDLVYGGNNDFIRELLPMSKTTREAIAGISAAANAAWKEIYRAFNTPAPLVSAGAFVDYQCSAQPVPDPSGLRAIVREEIRAALAEMQAALPLPPDHS